MAILRDFAGVHRDASGKHYMLDRSADYAKVPLKENLFRRVIQKGVFDRVSIFLSIEEDELHVWTQKEQSIDPFKKETLSEDRFKWAEIDEAASGNSVLVGKAFAFTKEGALQALELRAKVKAGRSKVMA